MSVENFRKEDLVGNSLNRLLAEIEKLANEGTKEAYDKLDSFIIQLTLATNKINVDKADGTKTIDAGKEEVDLIELLKDLRETIETRIDGNVVTNADQTNARDTLRKTISETIAILLKEDEIVQELVARGITDKEFEDYAKSEIAKSADKVTALTAFVKNQKALMTEMKKAVEAGTLEINPGEFATRSKADWVKHDNATIELLKKVEEKLSDLENLKVGLNSLDPNSPHYSNDKRVQEAAMQEKLGDIKGLTNSLKLLGIQTAPVGGKPGVKTTKIDFEYLEKLDLTSDFTAAKNTTVGIRSVDGANKSLETLAKEDYKELYEAKKAVMKKKWKEFGFASQAEVDALDAVADAAKIDKKISDLEAQIKKVDDEIKFEKNYQKQIEDGIKNFKVKADREKALNGKLTKVTKQVPKMKPDGTPEVDATGAPVMETVEDYEPTDAARKDYLKAAGVTDESKYKADAMKKAEDDRMAQVDALTTAEKRALIRAQYQDGKPHFFKWLGSQFFANRMWERGYKNHYLTNTVEPEIVTLKKAAEDKANKELAAKIAPAVDKDKKEREQAEADIAKIRSAAKAAIKTAASQEKIADELFRGTDEKHIEAGAKAAAVMSALEVDMMREEANKKMQEAMEKHSKGEITQAEFDQASADYKKAVKDARQALQDRAHADKHSKENRDRTTITPSYDER